MNVESFRHMEFSKVLSLYPYLCEMYFSYLKTLCDQVPSFNSCVNKFQAMDSFTNAGQHIWECGWGRLEVGVGEWFSYTKDLKACCCSHRKVYALIIIVTHKVYVVSICSIMVVTEIIHAVWYHRREIKSALYWSISIILLKLGSHDRSQVNPWLINLVQKHKQKLFTETTVRIIRPQMNECVQPKITEYFPMELSIKSYLLLYGRYTE